MSSADDNSEQPPQPTDEANLAALEEDTGGFVYEDDSDDAESNKTVYILEDSLEALKAAGFSENAIKKAYAFGCINVKTATQWITAQLGHPELDTPLDPSMGRVVIKKKVVLTPEQRAVKIIELKAKIANKKAAAKLEEAELARAAEKSRIAGGKLAMELKEELQARARAQAYIEQKREKEELLAAKEKIQLQIAIDKFVRNGVSLDEATIRAKEEAAKRREAAAAAHLAERQARADAAARMLGQHTSSSAGDAQSSTNASSSGGGGWDLSAILGAEQIAYSSGEASSATGAGRGRHAAAPVPAAPTTQSFNASAEDIEASEPSDALPRSPTFEGFTELIEKMQNANPAGAKATLVLLQKIISNIDDFPFNQKMRSLNASKSIIRTHLSATPYALSFLKLAGFQVGWSESPAGDGNATVVTKSQTLVMSTVIIRRVRAAREALKACPLLAREEDQR